MPNRVISGEMLRFLESLRDNNNREWFADHKQEFKEQHAAAKAFYESLMEQMKVHDAIEKLKLFRIYRDVRFSHDKTPYQEHFAGSFSRAGTSRRGGYYLRIKPGASFIAVGFWGPEKDDLLRIRKELEQDAAEFISIIEAPAFRDVWGSLQGDAVKTAPKGFDKDHPQIDLIRQKQFIFRRSYTDKQVLSTGFIDEVNTSFKAVRPFFDLMSEILTTDTNGQLLNS